MSFSNSSVIFVKKPIFPIKKAMWHFNSLIKGPSKTYIDIVFETNGLKGFFIYMGNDKHCRNLDFVWEETKYLDIQYLMCQHVAYTISSREEDIHNIIANAIATLEVSPTWSEKNYLIKEILYAEAQRCLEIALLKPRFLITKNE